MPDRHVMVDLETLDTQISAAIVSIGAVVFDPRGEDYQETFSLTIDEKSNRWHGRTVSDATLEWWAQPVSARSVDHILSYQRP
jgi:DNA polymerase III epsilon subunit-like protein